MTLSTRIVSLAVGLIGLVGLILGGASVAISHQLVGEASIQKTEDLAEILEALSRSDLYDLRVDRLNNTIRELRAQPSVDGLYVYGEKGLLLADGEMYPDSSYIQRQSPEIQEAVLGARERLITTDEQRIKVHPIISPTGRTMGVAVVELSRAREHYWLHLRRYQIVIFVGLLTLIGGLLAAYFSTSLIRPLETLRSALESPDNPFGKAFQEVEKRNDEIGQIAKTYRRVETARMQHERELLESQRALEKAKGQAEEAARVKSDFLANMSHEIRTPLNGLIGLNEILLKDDPRPEQEALLRTAATCGDGLLAIVNDLLDFSKIEAGRVRMRPEPVNLVQIAEDGFKLFASRLQESALGHHIEIEENFPQCVLIDGQRVSQIIQNLLANAIKFTEAGTITLSLRCERKEREQVDLICTISDTGSGIEPQHLERIFKRFSQADESVTRRHGGTGLGLAICHHLIELMQGTMTVESTVGRGSSFTFRIPSHIILEQAPDALTAASHTVADLGFSDRILIVEDNAINRRVVSLMLKHMGMTAVLAESGQVALDLLEKEAFEVILMDVQMPDMDGLETTRRIRKRPSTQGPKHPYIVALTAFAQESDRERCLESGMNDFITKPLKRDDLQRLFVRISAARAR